MTARVHPTAIIEDGAKIGDGAEIGPFCMVGVGADIGDGCVLHSHVVVAGDTRIGPGCTVFPFAVLGHVPQDLKYSGEPSRVEIGAGCRIREHVTIHPGTRGGGMVTRIGDDCLLMVGAHVAHDCQIGHHVILVNNATLGGHVIIGDHAIIGGLSGVHQFVRVGAHAMVGGMSAVESDVIPYGLVLGERAHLAGLNLVGLKRRGFARDEIHDLQKAYRLLFGQEGTFQERLDDVDELFRDHPAVQELVRFVRTDSPRSLTQPSADRAP
ncbi:MAG: acyl-ACP--UDP-N-acetylglucosamine O-acyltransferase [Proteobacteria bacterium]|nr:acyl-ACP--UDP-N-acetylglucosamine O-acyltransferase [Pseudomonadota bacterium]MDA1132060.1 acyl-ACP--UDP-N-acetylglucosamine O-acyltransferase [Pseudomonadota bacterium]